MNLNKIRFDLDTECGFFVRAMLGDRELGRAQCVAKARRLKIGDLKVRDDFIPSSTIVYLLRMLRPINLRGRGIDTKLLLALLRFAEENGFEEIWGEVVAMDEERANAAGWSVIAWYKGHGFIATEPDGECTCSGRIKKISKMLAPP